MEKKLIVGEGYNKYYRVALPENTSNTGNANFEKLLLFIGKHRPYRNRENVGSAYMAIRQRTDQLLGVSWKNPVLKTSKREVAAIRFYYEDQSRGRLFVKIPFKISYIFKAITQIVEEIHRDGYDTPIELQPFVEKTYLLAFYNEYVSAYDSIKNTIPLEMKAQKALDNDFHCVYSPLNTFFR